MSEHDPGERAGPRRPAIEETEVLSPHPPPAVARALAWFLLALFGAALAAAVGLRLPETVRCPMLLVPEAGSDPVQAPLAGVLQSVTAVEGREVEQGAELFRIRSEEARLWRTELRTLEEDLRALDEAETRLAAAHEAEMGIRRAGRDATEQEVAFREKHVATARRLLEGVERLATEGYISESELFLRRLGLAESEKDLRVAQRAAQQETLELARLETERARRRAADAAEREKLEVRIRSLRGRLVDSEGDVVVVRSPAAAVVTSVAQRVPGAVVQPGTELCQLARSDAGLTARLMPDEGGLSRLAPGQRVRILLQAYPYQRYGSVSGTLEWVSPASVVRGQEGAFVARASLDAPVVRVRGVPQPLRAGMRGEARVVVGSRTPIEYVLEPLRALRENVGR